MLLLSISVFQFSCGIDRGMIDLQFIWMTTSGQSTKNKEITEPQLDYVEDNFVTHNEVIVKSSQFKSP